MKKLSILLMALVLAVGCSSVTVMDSADQNNENVEIARSGCCSYHGGVCGCDSATDRIICCDGTYSPTCKCSQY